MGETINFGGRRFNAKPSKSVLPNYSSTNKQYFNFAATFNSLTGVVNVLAFDLFTAISFPFPVYLKQIEINGMYYDTTGSLAKTQPLITVDVYPFGLASNINTIAPNYTLGVSATIDKGISLTGILNNTPIEYISEVPLYIRAQTTLVVAGSANFFAAAAANDVLIINSRLVFEAA